MSTPDYAIITVLAISSLLSLMRGFVREAISLVVWVFAGGLALTFSPRLSLQLIDYIPNGALRTAAAFVMIFVAVVILGSIVGYLLGTILKQSGLSGTDRIAGLIFGFLRGLVIVAVFVMLGGMTALHTAPWWQESKLVPFVEPTAIWLREFLPDDIKIPELPPAALLPGKK